LKKLRWQFIIVLLTLVAIGALLLSQQQTSLSSSNNEDEPVSGGIYKEALVGSLSRLNPVLDFYNSVDRDIDRLIYCRLIKFDNRGLPYGDLAETWGISKDGKRYSFSIRPNAVWHDSQAVTSDDVIFTVELFRKEELPIPNDLRAFWNEVEARALDEKTLQFELPESYSPFLDYLSFGILPKHLFANTSPEEILNSNININPIGCGPFQFTNLNIENGLVNEVVLEAFQDYYGKKPFIDQVVFQYYSDSASALNAFKLGDVMGVSQIPSELIPEALKNEKLSVYTAREPRLSLIYLNLDDPSVPFFQDQRIRKALLMGINRTWIVNHLLDGQSILANSPIFPENWAFYEGVEQVDYDPDAAIAILKQVGYTFPADGGQTRVKDGVPLSFELVYPEGRIYADIAEQIRIDWERLGISVILRSVQYTELLKDYLEPHSFQAALVELNFNRSPDPDPYPFWHQSQINAGQNYSQWDDRQVSEYLEQARVVVEFNDRIKRYKNFQVRFSAELPALLLFYPVYSYGVDMQIKGVSVGPIYDPSDRFNNITDWYLLSEPSTIASFTPTEYP